MNFPMTPQKSWQRNPSVALSIAALASSRLKIPRVAMQHPVLCGDRNYLRDLRAAEMAAWEAGLTLKDYQFAAKLLEQVAQ